jgi:Bacteriophage Lambda NinG protein.
MTLTRTAFIRKAPSPEPKLRTRKCSLKGCRERFVQKSLMHRGCCPEHAIMIVQEEKARKDRKERQEGLQKIKRRADYLKEAQAALNAWIRSRDAELPCISCGRHHTGQYHAGHFLARGSHPHLALVEDNLAKQCMPCNVHLSGNQLEFKKGLIARIGLERVEALESDQTPRKYSIEELQAIKAHYRAKLKQLQEAAK